MLWISYIIIQCPKYSDSLLDKQIGETENELSGDSLVMWRDWVNVYLLSLQGVKYHTMMLYNWEI